MILANSQALRVAGITRNTPSPKGGEIVMDPRTGEPTGILKDAAMALVTAHAPPPSSIEKIAAAEAALGLAAQYGVTSVHEMADSSNFEVYRDLLEKNRLTSRISLYIPLSEADLWPRPSSKTLISDQSLKIAGFKGFVDGSLGSSTALFFEPYTDRPELAGLLNQDMFPEGSMEQRVMTVDHAGFQVAIHAIGDKANAMILDIFERTMLKNGPRARRWRVEHAQHLRSPDIERMAKLGIIASVQPYHAIDDGRWAESRIGRERCRTTYAFRSLLEKGVLLALGSDWAVAPLDPLAGIYAAVTRRTLDGKNPGGWFPEQIISLEDALRGYTINGAYAEFAEELKGSVAPGKLADLVILSQNIFKIPADEIIGTCVKITIVGGRIVFPK
jgi:predicted amidohydrolase YtcJ